MVVCRRHPHADNSPHAASTTARPDAAALQGGPVFLPRRKISPLAAALLAGSPLAGERSTAYDERLLGRPSV